MVTTLGTDSIRRDDGSGTAPGVLHLLPELDGAARSRAVIDMAGQLVASGARVFIAGPAGPASIDIQRAGAVHVPIALDRDNPVAQRTNAGRIESLIREQGIRLVQAHGRAAAWSGARAAKRTGTAFVSTFHRPYMPGGLFSGSGAQAMAAADAAIAVSQFVARTVVGHFPTLEGRLRLIPYGVDTDRFDPARVSAERVVHLATQWRLPDGVPVVMAGGLASRKSGHALLVEALGRLGGREHYCLMFASPDEYETVLREYEELARQHGIGARVHVLETCRDMPAALMLADVVAVPTAEPEPFSMAIAEAQLMGRPVVAAEHGAAAEQMADQPMGWLVPPGDAAALADALSAALDLTLVQRQHRAHDVIASARHRYSRIAVGDALIALYNELLPDTADALTGDS
jgi:glycosyltransferase involved in cell wall biosynthesis